MRTLQDLQKVIGRIIDVIPDDFVYKQQLSLTLNEIRGDCMYKAPELGYEMWQKVAYTLGVWLTVVVREEVWAIKIKNIFSGQEV